MMWFALFALFASALADDGESNLYSSLVSRIIVDVSNTYVPLPGFFPFPPIPFNASLDPLHARYEAWGLATPAEIDQFEVTCLDHFNKTFGLDFTLGTRNPITGVYFLAEAIFSPSSRTAPADARVMFDSEYEERAGFWTAREAVWNVEIQSNGAYGSIKAGTRRDAGVTLTCSRYYFTKVGADLTKRRNVELFEGRSLYSSFITKNEYNAQSLTAQVELTDEDGNAGRLTETILIQKNATGAWYLNSQSVFAIYK